MFSLGGFINAMFAKNFDQISWFPTFVLTPLTYLGGVFYSVTDAAGLGADASRTPIRSCTWSALSATASSAPPTSTCGSRIGIMVGRGGAMFSLAVTLMNRGAGIRE